MKAANSPFMYDVLYAIDVYRKAVHDGDLNPMLDWIIDGKYSEEYIKKNESNFP